MSVSDGCAAQHSVQNIIWFSSVCFLLPRGSGPTFDVSVVWQSFRDCSTLFVVSMKRPAATGLALEPVARSEIEPGVRPEVEVEHLSEAIPAPVSEVGSLSPTPREEPAIAIPPSSSRRQGAPAKRAKRVRRDEKKSPINKIVEGQAESSVRPRSLPFHQSDVSSDDPFGEDEIDNVRLNDAEAQRAAYMNLETEGGATGAAAFGVKRGRMPIATIAIARLYGWSSSGGFAEASCLDADLGRGQQKISDDLVGGPHGGVVHFCATDARTCSAGWPGRRVYRFDVWQPVTISGVGVVSASKLQKP